MAHCFVEFGAYGAIGDFEIDENMTQQDINDICWEIVEEFANDNYGIVIVDNKEDY